MTSTTNQPPRFPFFPSAARLAHSLHMYISPHIQRSFDFFVIFSVIITGAAALLKTGNNDLFTDPLTYSSANANAISSYDTLDEPSFVSEPPDFVALGDIFIDSPDDPSMSEGLDLLDAEADSELLASAGIGSVPPEACSAVLPFRSRRRRRGNDAKPLECTAAETEDEWKPYFRNFRQMAGQSTQKLSDFDASKCLGVLPYLICSSNNPFYSVYWPGILSWVLYESSRGMSRIVHYVIIPYPLE